jgi:hypothetical protein
MKTSAPARRIALGAFVGAPLALSVAGCGEATIDHTKAETLLRGSQTDSGRVTQVRCPSGVAARADKTFDCTIRLANGATGTWAVTIVNKQGLVRADPTDITLKTPPTHPKPPRGLRIGASVVQSAPGGSNVRVTLVRFTPSVAQPAPSPSTHVAGVTLRFTNLGNAEVRARRPTYYSVLRVEPAGFGADEVPHATGPCGGRFYRSPLRLKPGATVTGCIPYALAKLEVGSTLEFGFGFGTKNAVWALSR